MTTEQQREARSSAPSDSAHPSSALQLGSLLPQANTSHHSLLDAVIGPSQQKKQPPQLPQAADDPQTRSRNTSGSQDATSFGTSTEKSWDVLSDASVRVNRDTSNGGAVEELQKQVDKRKSQLPALEIELAALEAKIKEAEERLARAKAQAQTG
ncbi:hypothetical protein BD324DRAFT_622125 [Kockovaella imperatae]|uniref:Uncharacterized protein n=1 Tax=Kockovaella imperatae TaxID=4999 RepID=A0A1Y1UKZ8_9TREE|nr:hypothetical protein BD324DRAFT_622125 [Kockovaella imperatae]ORX38730.1 hypothetical protein BD324DRAFT_622125 [Kockovaella imperatae]